MVKARVVLAELVLAVTFVGCESPSGPPSHPPGSRVAVGDTVAGALNADSLQHFSFLSDVGAEYAVFLTVSQGQAILAVIDSATTHRVAITSDGSSPSELYENATNNFPGTPGRVLFIEIARFPGAGVVQYQFLVYRVERAPEGRSDRFTIGDTVEESIVPSPDVDDFITSGQAGDEWVGWINPLDTPAARSATIVVIGPTSEEPLAFGFGFTPGPTTTLTDRFVLPATGEYRFTVPVPTGPELRSRGRYRFHFYPIHRPPETASSTLAVNTWVMGEAIDIAGDVDEFTFAAVAGQEFAAFIQSTATRPVNVVPFGSIEGGSSVSAGPGDTAVFGRSTGRFTVVTTGGHGLRLSSELVVGATGPYRLYLYPINRAPELVPAAVSAGDTVSGETIELPGDIDEFAFTAAAGDQFNVFLDAPTTTTPGGVTVEVVDAADSLLTNTQVTIQPGDLLDVSTGRFTTPGAGVYRIRISGASGPYRFFLHQVDPQPEVVPATLEFGDSLDGEAIHPPGDVDEFAVTVAESSGANIIVERVGGTTGVFTATLLNAGTADTVAFLFAPAPDTITQHGRFVVSPGSYVLRLANAPGTSPARGAYRVWFYRFGLGPEVAADTIAIGDTVSEVIEPVGDADVFHFSGTARQHVNLAIQGLAPGATGGFTASISGATGSPIASATSAASSPDLHTYETNRVILPETGWYRVIASHTQFATDGPVFTERGPYRFLLESRSTAPEQVPETLAVGDSVVTEGLDYLGDWDEFVVNAGPGELAVLFYRAATAAFPRMLAFEGTSFDTLAVMFGSSGVRAAGPFTVPGGGDVRIAVFEQGPGYSYTGGYYLRVVPVNRAPEFAAPAFAQGDTVRGESVSPLADIDEYMGTGTPGAVLGPRIRLLANPTPAGRVITIEVEDPANGTVLVGNNAGVTGATTGFFSPGSFTVPPSGSYRVRVRAGSLFPDEVATAPYEFFVAP